MEEVDRKIHHSLCLAFARQEKDRGANDRHPRETGRQITRNARKKAGGVGKKSGDGGKGGGGDGDFDKIIIALLVALLAALLAEKYDIVSL